MIGKCYSQPSLIYCNLSFTVETDTFLLDTTIVYILSAERLKKPLFLEKSVVFLMQFFNPFIISLELLNQFAFLILTYYFQLFLFFVLPCTILFK